MKLLTATLISLVAGRSSFIDDVINNTSEGDFFSVLPKYKHNEELSRGRLPSFRNSQGKGIFTPTTTILNAALIILRAKLVHSTEIHLIKTSTNGYDTFISQIKEFDSPTSKSRITLPYKEGQGFESCVKEALSTFNEVFISFKSTSDIPEKKT
ncbi:hypothetical protein DSO57_1032619 [Entomophthora muscae]|uniref:Uncharacterized protein n=1 Tax=Entomophthora muscae TaxID=34485 RepID=A0ACC2TMQ3_9FUNG|nr:hypothetical protein DSO57_1032619 [Entomophthora muscae]